MCFYLQIKPVIFIKQLLKDNITKSCKKSTDRLEKAMEAKNIAKKKKTQKKTTTTT